MGKDEALRRQTYDLIAATSKYQYTYNFTWLGRPVIQFPQDLLAMQELIWANRPDLILETGIAHGGSLVFYASMLQLLGGEGRVLGVDIDIRPHNRREIEHHPLSPRITMMEGSSIDPAVVEAVSRKAEGAKKTILVLDSNHTHEHVLEELKAYSPLVQAGGYIVVFDTLIEFMPPELFKNRPWGPGNNPYTAVREFLKTNDRFRVDEEYDAKLLISVAPGGYLKCVKD